MKRIISIINLVCLLICFGSINIVKADVKNNNGVNMNLSDYYKYKDKNKVEKNIVDIRKSDVFIKESQYNNNTTLNDDTLNYSAIKEKIYESLLNIESIIDISELCKDIHYNDVENILSNYFDTIYEKPDIFYAPNNVSISYSYDRNTGKLVICQLKIQYQYDNSEIQEMTNAFNNKVNYIMEEYLSNSSDELTLEYIINDYLLDNVTYDYDNYQSNTIPDISHTAYGALVNGVAVCDGYAKAVKLLANKLGIESGIITSDEMNHAWNYIKINGNYYNIDVTFNDPVPETNKRRYTYFNKSNEEMSTSHTWNKSQYPECNDESFKFLRNYNNNDLSRVNDKLYYLSSNSNDIYSMDLLGRNSKLELQGIYPRYMVGYNNTLNFLDGYEVKSYNIKSKELKTIYTSESRINGLYITDNILNIDSTKIDKISLKINEDFNNDSIIDIEDLSALALRYGISKESDNWKHKYDLNLDNIIDIFDITMIAKKL